MAVREAVEEAKDRTPSLLQELVRRSSEHHVLTLAAGLAFFGLVSLGPALGVVFGVVRLAFSPETLQGLVDAMKEGAGGVLGLGDLLEQMEGRAARFAGVAMLVLLWPATTLASGWTRALDAVNEDDSTPAVRGLLGRLRGLAVGMFMLTTIVALVGLVAGGSALFADGTLMLVLAPILGVGGLFVFHLLLYRWLPSSSRPLSSVVVGAVAATVGVCVATGGFIALLRVAGQLEEQYPPALSTAVVLGLWLYAANACLLIGEELNCVRGAGTQQGD